MFGKRKKKLQSICRSIGRKLTQVWCIQMRRNGCDVFDSVGRMKTSWKFTEQVNDTGK